MRVTRGWQRLQELPALGLPLTEYPLPEVLEKQDQTLRQPGRVDAANLTEYAQRMRGWQQGRVQP
jgi:hypothetical protein